MEEEEKSLKRLKGRALAFTIPSIEEEEEEAKGRGGGKGENARPCRSKGKNLLNK